MVVVVDVVEVLVVLDVDVDVVDVVEGSAAVVAGCAVALGAVAGGVEVVTTTVALDAGNDDEPPLDCTVELHAVAARARITSSGLPLLRVTRNDGTPARPGSGGTRRVSPVTLGGTA